MPLTEDSVKVYALLGNLILKLICGVVALGVFVWVMTVIIDNLDQPVTVVSLSFVETGIVVTVGRMFWHYFPNEGESEIRK